MKNFTREKRRKIEESQIQTGKKEEEKRIRKGKGRLRIGVGIGDADVSGEKEVPVDVLRDHVLVPKVSATF